MQITSTTSAKTSGSRSFIGKLLFLFFIPVSITVLSECQAYSQGSLVTQKRDVSGFTGIALDLHADMSISQGTDFYVEIQAKQEVLDQIVTEKKGSDLEIRYKNNKWHASGDNPIRITVRLPKLNSLEINGSGNVTAESDFSTDKLSIEVNGSGDVKLKSITASSLSAEINGSGNIENLAGSIGDVDLEVNGSGDINSESLTGKSVSASVSGSGDIAVGVTDALDVVIAGSGNVYYKGNPSTIKKEVVGSGKVSQR